MDSDFSIDENDEPVSDREEESAPKRKKKAVNTRAYKEPVAKKKTPVKAPKEARPRAERQKSPKYTVQDSGRKSFRKTTAAKTAATLVRIKQRVEAEKRKPKVVKIDEYIPTQEELLEEAEETEKENLKSLGKFLSFVIVGKSQLIVDLCNRKIPENGARKKEDPAHEAGFHWSHYKVSVVNNAVSGGIAGRFECGFVGQNGT